jgi:aryl-alcohol dehydrogenase-like predicted oxidoreductase
MLKKILSGDLTVGAIGLGCSSMSHGYSPRDRDDDESVRVIHRALDCGVTLFDTADVYGPYSNEELLGRALRGHREQAIVATKCGLVAHPDGRLSRNGRPEHLKQACMGSLQRLQTDVIDLYQLHRIDPDVPLEETWSALADLVRDGHVSGLGISHATVAELELVHSLSPVTAVQYELSVWARHNLDDVLPWCRKNGVGFLAFSPIGRGYLTGMLDRSSLEADDSRNRDPRFASTAMTANQVIVEGLRTVGARRQATPAQVAIAWVLAQGDNVIPIPGTRRRRWLDENVAAAGLELAPADLRELNSLPTSTGHMSWDGERTKRTQATAAAGQTH